MHHFATLFDSNYLSRGLCLIDSLTQTLGDQYTLFVLALDDETADYILAKQNGQIIVLTLDKLEKKYPELINAKSSRSKIEFYFTLSPVLPLYILEAFDNCPRITTIDADIYFFSSPAVIFDCYGEEDILITPHDFSSDFKFLDEYGYYNVSFQSFPKNANSIIVLSDWKSKCIAWCGDVLNMETGYYADQKYLDEWTEKYDNIRSIDLKTCGRAPWNMKDTKLEVMNNELRVGGEPLIYYHFHHLRINKYFVDPGLDLYGIIDIPKGLKKIYSQYIRQLNRYNHVIKSAGDDDVLRYELTKKGSVSKNIWSRGLGALFIFNHLLFFNIREFKRGIYYIQRKINAADN